MVDDSVGAGDLEDSVGGFSSVVEAGNLKSVSSSPLDGSRSEVCCSSEANSVVAGAVN